MEAFIASSWAPEPDGAWRATILGRPGIDPRPLAGRRVRIDGGLHRVRRVVVLEVADPVGLMFALIVEPGVDR